MRSKTVLLSSIAVIGLMSWTAPAAAEEAPAAPSAAGQQEDTSATDAQRDEVIITARKRQESILNVPVVATVLSESLIEETAIDDLSSMKSYVPSMLVGQHTNSVGLQVTLRGVGTTAQNATMDQSISLNIDGLGLSQGVAYQAGMFDLAQIEVLKGPQSLFYGKNSPGGVISLRTADPGNEFELIARTGYEFEADEVIGELIVSGPVSDTLGLRFAGKYSSSQGYFKNKGVALPNWGSITPSYDDQKIEGWILRGTAVWKPSASYNARLKFNYTKDRIDGAISMTQLVYCPDGLGPVAPGNIPFLTGEDCKQDRNFRFPWADPAFFPGNPRNGGIFFSDSRQIFGTLEQNLDVVPGLSVASVTGYYKNDYDSLMHGATTAAITPFVQDYTWSNKQFTQELRITSDFKDSPVNFMMGAFYQDGHQQNLVRIMGNSRVGLPAVIQNVDHDVWIESFSVFGQLLWDVTDKLEFAAGARWTDETRRHLEVNLNPGNGPVGPLTRPDPKIRAANISPEISLTYKPTEDLTVFANYKQGFKSGSFNSINFVPANTLASFGDEQVEGFEAGIKARLFDRQLQFNLAAYTYDYSDLQVGALELSAIPGSTGFTFAQRTLNAASADVKGVEADLSFLPRGAPGLSLRAAIAYNDARYSSFPNAPCGNGQTIAEGCDKLFNAALGRYNAQDLTGRQLVRAPEWTGTAGFNYETSVGGGVKVRFGGDLNYTSSYVTTLVDLPNFRQEAFTKFNASLAIGADDDSWEVSLVGNNIGDKITRAICFNTNAQNGTILGGLVAGAATKGPAGSDEAACSLDRGREVWLRLKLKPGAIFGGR